MNECSQYIELLKEAGIVLLLFSLALFLVRSLLYTHKDWYYDKKRARVDELYRLRKELQRIKEQA